MAFEGELCKRTQKMTHKHISQMFFFVMIVVFRLHNGNSKTRFDLQELCFGVVVQIGVYIHIFYFYLDLIYNVTCNIKSLVSNI